MISSRLKGYGQLSQEYSLTQLIKNEAKGEISDYTIRSNSYAFKHLGGVQSKKEIDEWIKKLSKRL